MRPAANRKVVFLLPYPGERLRMTLGNALVKLSYSKKTTTETLEFHHIAVYGNQVEGIAGVMPPLLLCEPASQI